MKRKGIHEECIQQIYRVFSERLYTGGNVLTDSEHRIRVDDWELREDVQDEVKAIWEKVDTSNVHQVADVDGYNSDFLKLFGFGLDGVDYEADVDVDIKLG